MPGITQFTIEGVRCFDEPQFLAIRPLTFLVGENSTGKSTAMGCLHALLNYRYRGILDFNDEPYSMGNFTNIVRKRSGVRRIQLGYEFTPKQAKPFTYTITVAVGKGSAEPVVQFMRLQFNDGALNFYQAMPGESHESMELDMQKTDVDANDFHVKLRTRNEALGGRQTVYFMEYPLVEFVRDLPIETTDPAMLALGKFLQDKRPPFFAEEFVDIPHYFHGTVSFVAIREHPRRVYEYRGVLEDSRDEIPVAMMRLESEHPQEWEGLRESLLRFGVASGLFTDLRVKRLGDFAGAPFEVQIKALGPRVNLRDVGYGVSQILPIITRILSMPRSWRFLLQQPEVHLHPRGQAELISLFATLAKSRAQNFIVETHSDHMIDRARIEIMRGNIAPSDVSLIYFEAKGARVKVHNIGFDEQANMRDVPQGFRDFFLKETDALLGG